MIVDAQLVVGRHGDRELGEQLLGTVLRPTTRLWWLAFLVTGAGTVMLFSLIAYSVAVGVGVWGTNIPVGWAFPIINFVWWIGIGHAGTFISAILLLFEQRWRTSINRFAEAMTLFAIVQAAIFPLLHLGRAWFFYWLVPYPATMEVWPQFKSSLTWDVAAIATYATVSLLFWYLGLVPDLAGLRDTAPDRWRRRAYGLFALGWNGAGHHWRRYRLVYGLLAGLATPLVLSVHSVVSTDFAIALVPGWHSTIFPPYFVSGAILSGFAMVVTLLVPARHVFGMQAVITTRHFDAIGKMMLLTAWIVLYTYVVEHFMAWYSASPYEEFTILRARPFLSPSSWTYWFTMISMTVASTVLWFRRVRTSLWALWLLSLVVGMWAWTERFMIIALSLEHDFLPSSWASFIPTWVDIGILVGTLCFFSLLFLLFLRFVPFVAVHEMKELEHKLRAEANRAR